MKKLTWSERWDMSTIPDEALKAERARRNGLLGGRKVQPTRDKATAATRKANRERVRNWRAKEKAESD